MNKRLVDIHLLAEMSGRPIGFFKMEIIKAFPSAFWRIKEIDFTNYLIYDSIPDKLKKEFDEYVDSCTFIPEEKTKSDEAGSEHALKAITSEVNELDDSQEQETLRVIDKYNEYKLFLEHALVRYRKYISYFTYYLNERSFVNKHAQKLAVIDTALSLIERDGHGSQSKIISILINCKSFKSLGLSGNAKYLYDYLKRASSAKNEGTLVKFLVHNLKGEKSNHTKINSKVEKVLIYLARNGNKLVDKIIQHQINVILTVYPEINGEKLLTRRTVNQFLNKPWVKNLVKYGADPDTLNTLLPEIYNSKPDYPLQRAYIDGTRLQFVNSNKDVIQELNIIIILDGFSSKVIGYSLDDSENANAIMNAFDLMLDWTNDRVPEEIVTDRHSALTGHRFKRFIDVCNRLGTTSLQEDYDNIMLIQTSNPQSKGTLERFFRSFQDAFLSPYFGYVGEGIKSNNEKAFPNRILKIFMQRKEYLKDRRAMDDFIFNQIVKYNNHGFFYKESGPTDAYNAAISKDNGIYISSEFKPCLLYEKKSLKVSNCVIKTQIENREYIFQHRHINTLLELNGKTVDVYFDKKRLDRLYIYKKDTYMKIGEFERISRIHPSSRHRNKREMKLYASIMSDKKKLTGKLNSLLIQNNEETHKIIGPAVPEKLLNHSINSKEELYNMEFKEVFSDAENEKYSETDLLYNSQKIKTKKRRTTRKKKELPFPEL